MAESAQQAVGFLVFKFNLLSLFFWKGGWGVFLASHRRSLLNRIEYLYRRLENAAISKQVLHYSVQQQVGNACRSMPVLVVAPEFWTRSESDALEQNPKPHTVLLQ